MKFMTNAEVSECNQWSLVTIVITGQMLKVRGQEGNTGKKIGMERRAQEMPQIEILIDASAAAEI